MSFGRRLKTLRREQKLKIHEISKYLGVSQSSISSYELDKTRPTWNHLIKICEILKCTPLDLLDEHREIKQKIVKDELTNRLYKYTSLIPKKLTSKISDQQLQKIKQIPLLRGFVGAGSGNFQKNSEIEDYLHIDECLIDSKHRDSLVLAIKVQGDSMQPYISNNDYALFTKFKKDEDILIDGRYIINSSQGAQIKKLQILRNGNIRVISENPSFTGINGYDEEVQKDDKTFEILGNVCGRILRS